MSGERAPWRHDAEVDCMKSGSVKIGTGVVRVDPIEGPGMCGADFPLKVAALGEGSSVVGYADDVRPPGSIPNSGADAALADQRTAIRAARANSIYWDTDGSTAGNNASTGANLGGSGIWSTADANWWDTSLGTPQVWTDGSDAVFWGTAGAVTASTVSANSLAFKTTGYSVNSGTLTMIGAASTSTWTPASPRPSAQPSPAPTPW